MGGFDNVFFNGAPFSIMYVGVERRKKTDNNNDTASHLKKKKHVMLCVK